MLFELNLTRQTKKSPKGRSKKEYCPLLNKAGKLVTTDEAKAEVLNSFCLKSSMPISLPRPLKSVDCKTGTGRVMIKFITT